MAAAALFAAPHPTLTPVPSLGVRGGCSGGWWVEAGAVGGGLVPASADVAPAFPLVSAGVPMRDAVMAGAAMAGQR